MKTVLTITGPSASGKSFLEKLLVEQHGFNKVISHTTRARRPGEEHGQDYYFMSREIFEQAEANGEFVEVVEFNGQKYGGSLFEFENAFLNNSKPVVVVCEPNGRAQITERGEKEGWLVINVWVENPAPVIARRMTQRLWDDMMRVEDNEKQKDALLRFENRLAAALSTELGWRHEAWEQTTSWGEGPYDIMFLEFDATTQDEVINAVLHYVEMVQKGITTADQEFWETAAGIPCGSSAQFEQEYLVDQAEPKLYHSGKFGIGAPYQSPEDRHRG